jgi:hypothetical protein
LFVADHVKVALPPTLTAVGLADIETVGFAVIVLPEALTVIAAEALPDPFAFEQVSV